MDLLRNNYSSSGEEEEEAQLDQEQNQEQELVSLVIPELPTSILDKYHITPNTERYRNLKESEDLVGSFGNIGMFSGFIYIQWRPSVEIRRTLLHNILKVNYRYGTELNPLFLTELGSPIPLHVSLSQNINFESQSQRDFCYKTLKSKIHENNIAPFKIDFNIKPVFLTGLDESKKTLFLTLQIKESLLKTNFKTIHECVHESLRETFPTATNIKKYEINLNTLHMSIGQMVNTPQNLLAKYKMFPIEPLEDQFPHSPTGNSNELMLLPTFLINEIKCDKNREVISINLSNRDNPAKS